MVDWKDPLPMTRQCALLDLPRSSFYHVPKPVSEEELELMALIDRCHLKHPFYGSRRIRDWLEDDMCQDTCPFLYAASSLISVFSTPSFSGFSHTSPTGSQFRVPRLHRSGFRCFAAW